MVNPVIRHGVLVCKWTVDTPFFRSGIGHHLYLLYRFRDAGDIGRL